MTRILATRHVLAVQDLRAAAEHFIDVLGFSRDLTAEGWEFLSLGEFRVMLGECPAESPASETGNHSYFAHVLVEDVDSLFEAMKSRGAVFTQEIADKPWGLREFHVVTPEGHRLGFAQDIKGA